MNKFLEFFKSLFDLSDAQIEKAELELKNTQKSDLNNEERKETVESVESIETNTDNKSVDDKVQSAYATPKKDGETMENTELQALQEELKSMKALLEQTQSERAAEKRNSKIKSIKDCVDYDILISLLDGVEEKDIDKKIDEIKKEKSYLFKKVETEGFNPSTPQNILNGVESAFYELNPDLKI